MKKIVILLTLVMVFGLGVSAMAADLKTSGKVYVNLTNDGDVTTWANGFRVQFDGKLDDNSGFQIRLDSTAARTATDGAFVAPAMKRAFYYVNLPGLGKVTAGLQDINYSVLDQLTSDPEDIVNGDGMDVAKAAVAFAPALPEGFSAVGFYAPDALGNTDNDLWGFQASGDFGVASVYGGYNKATSADDGRLSLGAKAPIIPDTLSVYGEYTKIADGDANDEKTIGANYTAGGFNSFVEYGVDSKTYMVETYKTIKNVEFNAIYIGGQGADNEDHTFTLKTTMYF